MIEAGFHDVFGVDLEDVWPVKTWRWFRTRLTYLVSVDSALARHFHDTTETETEPASE